MYDGGNPLVQDDKSGGPGSLWVPAMGFQRHRFETCSQSLSDLGFKEANNRDFIRQSLSIG